MTWAAQECPQLFVADVIGIDGLLQMGTGEVRALAKKSASGGRKGVSVVIRRRMSDAGHALRGGFRILRSCFKITGEFPSTSEKVAVKAGKLAHICLYGRV